jgi:membrane protein
MADSGSRKARSPGPVRRVAGRALAGAWDDDIFSESASAAFWQTLSLPPLLLGLFGVLGYVGGWFGPDTVTGVQQWIVHITSGVFSDDAVKQIIEPTVGQILTTARGEVVSVGFVLSFWSGSSAMAAFTDAITRAHGQYQLRHLVWQRILAALLYVVALVFGIIALPLVAIGPDRILPLVPAALRTPAGAVVATLSTPVVGLALVLALTTLYRIALPYKPPWWRGLPGAVLAAIVFLVGVTGLRIYLDWITGTGYTYGALAAPIAFLLATFFIALAIILGAHVNAAIQAEWPAVLRRRGRVMARLQPVGTPDTAPLGLTTAIERDPAGAAPLLDRLGYEVRRREPDAPADPSPDDEPAPRDAGPDDPVDAEPPAAEESGHADVDKGEPGEPRAQDHAPPDMAADRAR